MLNKSQFLRDEHARLEQETTAQRWVEELTRELESARLSELYERDHAARSALNLEQLVLGAERSTQAVAEGQAQSRVQQIDKLEAELSRKDEGLRIVSDTMDGEWLAHSIGLLSVFCYL